MQCKRCQKKKKRNNGGGNTNFEWGEGGGSRGSMQWGLYLRDKITKFSVGRMLVKKKIHELLIE